MTRALMMPLLVFSHFLETAQKQQRHPLTHAGSTDILYYHLNTRLPQVCRLCPCHLVWGVSCSLCTRLRCIAATPMVAVAGGSLWHGGITVPVPVPRVCGTKSERSRGFGP